MKNAMTEVHLTDFERVWTTDEVIQMLMDDYGLTVEEAEDLIDQAIAAGIVNPQPVQ
jgi:hypothetical protein